MTDNGPVDADPTTEPVRPADDLEVPEDWAERTDDDPAEVARIREERASKRLRQTVRDMVISMLVVSGAVVLLAAPWNRSTPDPVRVVDPTTVVQGARAAEPWPVLAPQGLPSTWRCTNARISTASDGQDVVHLGYLTPDNLYVGLEQSATKALAFVTDATVSGRQTGSRDVGGTTWATYQSDDGTHRSLVRTADGATYVVVGTAPWDVIDKFATSLRPG